MQWLRLVFHLMLAAAVAGCEKPVGFVLVEVDTDLPVPQLADHIRLDVYSKDGGWLNSRNYAVAGSSSPANQRELSGAVALPLSFALEPELGVTEALVRVRAYRERAVRDYLGERYEPATESARPPMRPVCDDPPLLEVGGAVELSASDASGSASLLECAGVRVVSNVTAARISIQEPGDYRIAIDRLSPDGPWCRWGAPAIFLTRACTPEAFETFTCKGPSVDCRKRETSDLELTAALEPGNYFILLGNTELAALEARLTLAPNPVASDTALTSEGDARAIPEAAEPRLVVDELDVTPSVEPEPGVAVDRLARIFIDTKRDQTAQLILRGDCLGLMADVAGLGSCTHSQFQRISKEPLVPYNGRGGATLAGSWKGAQAAPCAGSGNETRVCVPGGAFTLGDARIVASGADAASPERVVIIEPFFLDRHEFSVRRYRELVAQGKAPRLKPQTNRGELTVGSEDNYCTYNDTDDAGNPTFPEREDLPLSCVSWHAARAICQVVGGDLPTSAQWEYASTAAGRIDETVYPWSDDAPSCEQAVFARWFESFQGQTDCLPVGFGPTSVLEPLLDMTPLGIIGLGGNVSEWTLDSHRSLSDACWGAALQTAPTCDDPSAALRTVKGSSWRTAASLSRGAARFGVPPAALDDSIGFRCAYVASGEP